LIAYSGQDVGRLANKDQVHKSFGTPDNVGNENGCEFEEFVTHRKISEPTVGDVNVYLCMETLGLLELWNFPAAIVHPCGAPLRERRYALSMEATARYKTS
jgi:hypothetical protein